MFSNFSVTKIKDVLSSRSGSAKESTNGCLTLASIYPSFLKIDMISSLSLSFLSTRTQASLEFSVFLAWYIFRKLLGPQVENGFF